MPTRYAVNPFAVLGVRRDCAKPDRDPAVKQRRMELRLAGEDDDALRRALQTIENPQARLRHEIFWPDFTPAEWAQGLEGFTADETGAAVRAYEPHAGDDVRSAHNLAILAHAHAIAAEEAGRPDAGWDRALKSWRELLERPGFWEGLGQRVVELADARLRLDELDVLRRELPEEVLAPAGGLASRYLREGKADDAKRLFDHVVASGFDRSAIDETLARACAALVTRLEGICAHWEEFTSAIEGKKKKKLVSGWAELRAELVAPVRQLCALEPHQPRGVPAIRDRAAKLMRNYAVNSFNAKRCREVAREALEAAASVAASEAERKRIAKDQRDLKTTEEDDVCAFCGQESGGAVSEEVYVHRILEVVRDRPGLDRLMLAMPHIGATPQRIRYNHVSFKLPRCGECRKVHKGKPSATHALAGAEAGCAGCVVGLLAAGGLLGFYYWATEFLDGWDYGAAAALFLLSIHVIGFFQKRADARRKRGKIPSRPWSTWTEWPRIADLLANGYVEGKEPAQEVVDAYINGDTASRSRYEPKSGQRYCRDCAHRMPGPAERCANCGGERLAYKDPRRSPAAPKPVQVSVSFAGVCYVVVLVVATAVCLRPCRDEIYWRIARFEDRWNSYYEYLDEFPDGKYASKALTWLEKRDWEDATRANDYWSYLAHHPDGARATEALESLHAAKPWKGETLIDAIRRIGRIRLRRPLDDFLWARVREENTIPAYLDYGRLPRAQHADEALRLADDLAWAGARRQDTRVAYNEYLKRFKLHAGEARGQIEELPWREASAKNTERAYREFVGTYPKSPHAAAARAKLDDFAWERAVAGNRIRDYEAYQRLYPKGRHLAEVARRIDEVRWVQARGTDTLAALDAYVRLSPQGAHVGEAKARIDELRWRDACREHSVVAYRGYLTSSPEGAHRDEADVRIREWPWLQAVSDDTIAGYKRLLKDPNTPHAEEAALRIQELIWEQTLRLHTVEAYHAYIAVNPNRLFAGEAARLRDALQARADPVRDKTSAFTTGPKVRASIDRSELEERRQSGSMPDRPVAQRRTEHVSPGQVRGLKDHVPVIGVVIGHQARAYPVASVRVHGIVNDVLAGVPIAVQSDWLSGATGAFSRRLDDRVLYFAPTKLAYRCTAVYYDTETETFWNPVLGEATVGPLTGSRLAWIPSTVTTWGEWRALHPGAKVVVTRERISTGYRPYDMFEASRVTGGASELAHPTGPHPIRPDHPVRESVDLIRDGEGYRGYVSRTLRDGETVDGAYRIHKQGTHVQITRDGKDVPRMRVYWFAWCALAPRGVILEPD